MKEDWKIYAASLEGNLAWISFNYAYAEIAEKDNRKNHFCVRIKIKQPTEGGMPAQHEFSALNDLDDSLADAINSVGGIYVGRITVGGYRYCYYYLKVSKEQACLAFDQVDNPFHYEIDYIYAPDPDKKAFWEDLYPTEDDWQVIKDLEVMHVLAEKGDNKDKKREVNHWAYFDNESDANKFASWAKEQNYQIVAQGKDKEDTDYKVQFSHVGTMNLDDITSHTIIINRKAKELHGNYDGWETSLERS